MVNSKIAIEMQNSVGRFLQLYHLNKLELAKNLFCEDGHLWLPDRNIDVYGIGEISKKLLEMQNSRIALGTKRDCHIAHTPAFDNNEDESIGMATWDLHSFQFDDEETVNYVYSRIDARFKKENNQWKILELDWWDVESFTPWEYDINDDCGIWKDYSEFKLPPQYTGKTSPSDFYEIQNTLSRFVHNNRKYFMEDTFLDSEEITFQAMPIVNKVAKGKKEVSEAIKYLADLEEKNKGKYVYVPTTGTPVIEVNDDGYTANAQWMTSIYTFEGEAFGIEKLPYKFVRRLGMWSTAWVKSNNQWRLKDSSIKILFTQPPMDYDSYCEAENPYNKRYQRIGLFENKWKPALPKMGGNFPEEMAFLESFPARWVNAYRTGNINQFIKDNAINEEHETYFLSRSGGRSAKRVIGSDKLDEFFSKGLFSYHHQQITNHGGMSPDIEVSADGRYATISLYDMNTTAYIPNTGNSDVPKDWTQENSGYEHTPCRYQLSIYEFEFAKVDGVWKIVVADWETIASMEYIELAGKTSKGWAGSITDVKYPALFEKYRYSSKRKIENVK